jgi:hypothetical protein
MLAVSKTEAYVDTGNLSAATRDRLERAHTAAISTQLVTGSWQSLARRALLVGTLVDALNNHDATVFSATQAGVGTHWDDALRLLEQSGTSLAAAAAGRDTLKAAATATPTLDNLLLRYAAYDSALADLYSYMRDDGDRSTEDFATRNETLERAQAALPEATTILSLIVDEAAGSLIDANLAAIQVAAKDIERALQ